MSASKSLEGDNARRGISTIIRHGIEEVRLRVANADTNSLIPISTACGCNNVFACAPCAVGAGIKITAIGIQALSLVGKRGQQVTKTVK